MSEAPAPYACQIAGRPCPDDCGHAQCRATPPVPAATPAPAEAGAVVCYENEAADMLLVAVAEVKGDHTEAITQLLAGILAERDGDVQAIYQQLQSTTVRAEAAEEEAQALRLVLTDGGRLYEAAEARAATLEAQVRELQGALADVTRRADLMEAKASSAHFHGWLCRERLEGPDSVGFTYPAGLDYEGQQEYAFQHWLSRVAPAVQHAPSAAPEQPEQPAPQGGGRVGVTELLVERGREGGERV